MWILITVIALGLIVGGILLLQQSAKKFQLTPEQLARIKQRNKALNSENKKNDE